MRILIKENKRETCMKSVLSNINNVPNSAEICELFESERS